MVKLNAKLSLAGTTVFGKNRMTTQAKTTEVKLHKEEEMQ